MHSTAHTKFKLYIYMYALNSTVTRRYAYIVRTRSVPSIVPGTTFVEKNNKHSGAKKKVFYKEKSPFNYFISISLDFIIC